MASVKSFEGVVENGQIRLRDGVLLPDRTKVYVVVPEMSAEQSAMIRSPRLVHPEQAADFGKQIVEVKCDAHL